MKRTSVNPWDWGLQFSMDATWIADAGTRPPQSLLGINRVFLPELVVEIEVVAGA